MSITTVAIIGFGGLGSMYAAYLSPRLSQGSMLHVIATADRVQRYRSEGLRFNGDPIELEFRSYDEVGHTYDLVIYAVKFHALATVIEQSASLIGTDTTIISVLNGISSEELLAERFGSENVLLSVAQQMDASKDGADITCGSIGFLALGNHPDNDRSRLDRATAFFDTVSLPYLVPDDIIHQMWGKLMLNTGVNQACAVFDCDFEGVHREGEARTAMIEAMKEVAAVAAYRGVSLTEDDLTYWIDIVDALNPAGKPSLRQDVLAHRMTEVELFSGTIRALGDRYGVDTPVNDMLYRRIRQIENGY